MSALFKRKITFFLNRSGILLLNGFLIFMAPCSLLKVQAEEYACSHWFYSEEIHPNFAIGATAALGLGAGLIIGSIVNREAESSKKRGARGLTGPVGGIGPVGLSGPAATPPVSINVTNLKISFSLSDPYISHYQAIVTTPNQLVYEQTVTNQTNFFFGSGQLAPVFTGTYTLTAQVNFDIDPSIQQNMEIGIIRVTVNDNHTASEYPILISPINTFTERQISFQFTVSK